MSQPLFFVGNKRSGTSLLVRLLNLHPEIFASHESDIVWILYQARDSWPKKFQCYPWDGPIGMNRTLDICADIFEAAPPLRNDHDAILNVFKRVQERLGISGGVNGQAKNAGEVKWMGDKKPVQQCDPELRSFMQRHFPEARYLHIVRHPRAVIASKLEAVRKWAVVPEFWKKRTEYILERWATHEEWVLQAREREGSAVHTLRFEDLCDRPVEMMEKVYAFLGLSMPNAAADRMRKDVQPNPNQKHESFSLPISPHAKRIMDIHQYT